MIIRPGRDFYDDAYSDDDDRIYVEKEDEPKKLCFPQRIIGRTDELERIKDCYREFCCETDRRSGDLPFLLNSGFPGTGKSKLVSGFRNQLMAMEEMKKPLFLEGKYHPILLDQEPPTLSAILEAFARLADHLHNIEQTDEKQRLISSIKDALGHDINAVETLLPGLTKALGHQNIGEQTPFDKGYTFNNLLYVLQSLVKALCSENKPLILFMDDLQWADQDSLDLTSILLRDQSIHNFMVVSCARSCYGYEGGLRQWLCLLEENIIKRIELNGFSLEETNCFVAESLELKPEETSSLTMAVYDKTRGNVTSTIHTLDELHRKNIIHFSVVSFQWEWNVTAVERLQAMLSDDVLMAVIGKIESFPQKLQRVLAIAAYTRSVFDKTTLHSVIQCVESSLLRSEDELSQLLEMALLEGAVTQTYGSPHYRFAHDKIQQALQSHISSKDPDLVPAIGKGLYQFAIENNGEDWMFFVAASHLTPTFPSEDPIFVAHLFLESGQRAFRLAAFGPAAKFLRKGLRSLGRLKTPWISQYRLTLDLHKTLADSEFNLGNFEEGNHLCSAIFLHASSLLDELPAYRSYVTALGRNMDLEKSKYVLLHVLVLLGECPERLKGLEVFRKLQDAKQYFKKHSDSDILQLPPMTDERLIWTMVFTADLATRAFQSHDTGLSLQLALQIIKLTAKHGLCGESALGYALYADHVKMKGDLPNAMRFAGCAKEVSNRFSASRTINFFVIYYVDCWILPATACLIAMQQSQRLALTSGETESAFLLSVTGHSLAFDSGYPLDAIEKNGAEIMEQARLTKMSSYVERMSAIRLPVIHLVASNETPIKWSELEKCDIGDSGSNKKCHTYSLIHFYIGRLLLGNLFGNLSFAEKMANQLSNLNTIDDSYVNATNSFFFPGLTFSRLAKQTGKAKYILRARSYRKKLHDKLKGGACSVLPKYLLLNADLSACLPNKKTATIRAAYDEAITSAMKSGFVNLAALGSEVAGEYFGSKGASGGVSREYFTQALDFYKAWGATRKVEDLLKRHSAIPSRCPSTPNMLESNSFIDAERAKDLQVLSVLKPRVELPC